MKNNNIVQNGYTNSIEVLLKKDLISRKKISLKSNKLPEVLVISTFPPKQCGIATYTQDLLQSLKNKFKKSFDIKICALDDVKNKKIYGDSIKCILDPNNSDSFSDLADEINTNNTIQIVLIQHEFGLYKNSEELFVQFLQQINKSVLVVFHTVLPKPNEVTQQLVKNISNASDGVIVMTNTSKNLLLNDYQIQNNKIAVIPHGTHLVANKDTSKLKKKYNVKGKKILSTFGLLSSGKGLETTIEALPDIIKKQPNVLFLIMGKTHPSVVKSEGEVYRNSLVTLVEKLKLQNHVRFINEYLPLETLLDYLQMTDIYLFTSKDPNQAVSGTFVYAISCGCPIISTPIPHVCEVLKKGNGIIIDFDNPKQLAHEVIHLLEDKKARQNMSLNGLHEMAPTAWENSAIAHAKLFEKVNPKKIKLTFKNPEINLNHINRMTDDFGMIQFSKINKPDINSGYTLDDNARALIALCKHYELTRNDSDLKKIDCYYNFIKYCWQSDGYFLNYVDENKDLTAQNYQVNLDDSNGRAIWALGYFISMKDLFPVERIIEAEEIVKNFMINAQKIHSTRAMSFIIKGLYLRNINDNSLENVFKIKILADKMVQMYKHEADSEWQWFESYLTYGNSIMPEALLCAYLATGELHYKEIAKTSFDFLLDKIFVNNRIKVISNDGWLHNGEIFIPEKLGGEQPIDVAYTILALNKFYEVFEEDHYLDKMKIAFSWFLGNNHLNQIIYNPATGGCYDGLEKDYINLNQGAESTVSYLMARLTIEKNANNSIQIIESKFNDFRSKRKVSV